MTKRLRNWLAVLGAATLLLTAVALKPSSTAAANLTGGNYTYLVNGEEVTFTFDPVLTKDGVLLPFEVFHQFGVRLDDNGKSRSFTLTKGSVTAELTVGNTSYLLNDQSNLVSTPPLRLNGRLFIPADLLAEFGVDFSQYNNYVYLRSYVGDVPEANKLSTDDFNRLRNDRGILGQSVKSDAGTYLSADFLLLNDDLINSSNLGLSFGVRARLLSMLDTNTLVYVKISNFSNKAGGLVTGSTYLVDDQRNEYEPRSVVDIGSGLVSSKLVPGATRVGVLVYGKLATTTTSLFMYYDPNGETLRGFPFIK